MRKKIITALAIASVGAVSLGAGADAAGRDGGCVAANLSALPGATKSAVAKSEPGALAGVIQFHLDGELDLLGVCGD